MGEEISLHRGGDCDKIKGKERGVLFMNGITFPNDGMSAVYFAEVIAGVILVGLTLGAILGLVCWIFRSLGQYRLSKRRGIHHAWMAWLPVFSAWNLGCISDQYQYLVKGKNTKRRVILVVLTAISQVLGWCCVGAFLVPVFRAVFQGNGSFGGPVLENQIMAASYLILMLSNLLSILSVVILVFRSMALYDLYSSCTPRDKVLFLVLGILFSVAEPFFIFACRNKDEGMPPRRPEIEV